MVIGVLLTPCPSTVYPSAIDRSGGHSYDLPLRFRRLTRRCSSQMQLAAGISLRYSSSPGRRGRKAEMDRERAGEDPGHHTQLPSDDALNHLKGLPTRARRDRAILLRQGRGGERAAVHLIHAACQGRRRAAGRLPRELAA